jgi:membrane fusion protein, multidrug efflux system
MRDLMVVGVVAAFVATMGCTRGQAAKTAGNSNAPRAIAVDQVTEQDVKRSVEVVGTLAGADEVTVSAEAAGRVIRIVADLGDHVRAGDAIVELDREKLQDGLDQQRAALSRSLAKYGTADASAALPPIEDTPDVKKAAAALSESEKAWKRAKELTARSLLAQAELETAEAKYVADRAAYDASLQNGKDLAADIDASRAAVRLAERQLTDASIRAPFDGYVQKRLVSLGQLVQVQTPIATIVQNDPLKLVTEVPERMAPWVKVGARVVVRVDAYPNRAIAGTVSRISPGITQQTRSFAIEARVPNADGLLKPGTFARASIDSDRTDRILTVPAGAVQNRYGVNRIFALDHDHLVAHEVKLGDRLGDRVEVTEGITAGATVAASDVDVLADGLKVQAVSQTSRRQ